MVNTPTGFVDKIGRSATDTATWLVKGLHAPNNPPAMHRLKSTFGLFAGLYVGRKLMDIVVGETPSGKVIDKETLPAVLQPLHGLMHYNHYSDDPHDRWLKVVDNIVPAIIGGVGAVAGSYNFVGSNHLISGAAASRLHTVETNYLKAKSGNALSLDTIAPKIGMAVSEKQRIVTAASAIPGSASGSALGPGNLGIHFGETFLSATGRKPLAVPECINNVTKLVGLDLNKYIHFVDGGGVTSTGFDGIHSIQPMIDYLSKNKSHVPEQMESLAHGILSDLFGKNGEAKVADLVRSIQEVRLVKPAAGAPHVKAAADIEKGLKKMLTGVGLDETLITMGLDPRKSSVFAPNAGRGILGRLAMWMGAEKPVGELATEYSAQLESKWAAKLNALHPATSGHSAG